MDAKMQASLALSFEAILRRSQASLVQVHDLLMRRKNGTLIGDALLAKCAELRVVSAGIKRDFLRWQADVIDAELAGTIRAGYFAGCVVPEHMPEVL